MLKAHKVLSSPLFFCYSVSECKTKVKVWRPRKRKNRRPIICRATHCVKSGLMYAQRGRHVNNCRGKTENVTDTNTTQIEDEPLTFSTERFELCHENRVHKNYNPTFDSLRIHEVRENVFLNSGNLHRYSQRNVSDTVTETAQRPRIPTMTYI